MKRKHAKVDANQGEIVKALREFGCSVQSLAGVGCGVPDLLVARNGRLWLMEVKDGSQVPSKRRLTPDELKWRLAWNGPVYTVESVGDAIVIASSSPPPK